MTINIKKIFTSQYIILLLTIWQFFSVLLMAIGVWPREIVWVNLVLGLIFILLADVYDSVLFLIVSIPFFVALPNSKFDSLSIWRIWFFALFLIWVVSNWKNIIQKQIQFMPWDKYLGWFVLVALLATIFFAKFPWQGMKQIAFWLNIFVFYLVFINTIKTKQQIVEVTKYVVLSFTIIISLGYIQLFSTFFTSFDVFWVYWASFITKLYYGSYFSSVSLYSNSWFSYTGAKGLRMFSIMPDSQSFAYLTIFALGWATAYSCEVSKKIKSWLWSGIRFAGLAMILSGTRAVWAGMIAPFFAMFYAYWHKFMRVATKRFFWPFIIIFALFAISPLINKGLHYLRVGGFQEDFLSRVKSIYDLNEISNAGRIAIWKSSTSFAVGHLQGVGLGNFIVSQTPDLPKTSNFGYLALQLNKRYNLPQKYITAHNLYLHILVELGILGLFTFGLFCYKILQEFWQFLKQHKEGNGFLIFFVFQSNLVFLWILASAFFDVTLFNDKVLMYFFLTLGLSGIIIKNYQSIK